MEADRTTIAVSDQHLIITIGHTNLDQAVILAQGDRVHAILART